MDNTNPDIHKTQRHRYQCLYYTRTAPDPLDTDTYLGKCHEYTLLQTPYAYETMMQNLHVKSVHQQPYLCYHIDDIYSCRNTHLISHHNTHICVKTLRLLEITFKFLHNIGCIISNSFACDASKCK